MSEYIIGKYDIGNVFTNNKGLEFKIVEVIDSKKRKVRFLKSNYETSATLARINKGEIMDRSNEKYNIGTKHESKDGYIFEIIEKIDYINRRIRFIESKIEKCVAINSIKNKSIRSSSYKINIGEMYNDQKIHEIIIEGINYKNKNVNNILYTINENGCWECFSHPKSGGRNKEYIGVKINGKSTYLHRASYITYKGKIPKGMEVMHICDNPICCNPKHLKIGTHKENNDDKVNKNRQLKGSDVGNSILEDHQVIEIIKLRKSGLLEREIAEKYNICRGTVHSILRGKIWSHLTGIQYDKNIHKSKKAEKQSGEVGVKWSKSKNKWEVVIKYKYIGSHKNLDEAIKMKYDYLKNVIK